MSTQHPKLKSWLNVIALEDRTVPASLIDRSSTLLGSGDASATVLGISDNGRYAIFSSLATNLVQGQIDIPGTKDLFWTDLLTGEVELVTNQPTVSIDSNNVTSYNFDRKTTYAQALPGQDAFSQAVISGDGKFVAFNSVLDASMIDSLYITKSESPNSTDVVRTSAPDRGNSTLDVFRWSEQTGDTRLASRTYFNSAASVTNPNEAFGRRTDSIDPAISTDGSRVSFVSKFNAQDALPQRNLGTPAAGVIRFTDGAENLVFDNGDTSNDIFVTDFTDIGTNGFVPTEETINNFYTTVMSKVFSGDLFVQDFTPGTATTNPQTTLVAIYPGFTTFGDLGTTQIGVDPNGRYLGGDGLTATFVSNVDASELNLRSQVNGTFNRRTYAASTGANVYWTQFGSTTDVANIVRLVTTGSDTTTAGTVNSSGGGGGTAQNAILSRNDPTGVLFVTSVGSTAGSQIVAGYGGDPTAQQLYFRRMNDEIGDTAVLVTAINGSTNTPGNGTLPISNVSLGTVDPTSYQIAAGGSAVVFTTSSSNMFTAAVLKDTNNANDVFVRDLTTNTLSPVSVRAAGKQTGAAAATTPSIGADGRYITFQSAGTDYVSSAVTADTNNATDIFLRDRSASTTTYISAVANGSAAGNGASTGAFVGNQGTTSGYVVFTSAATDLDSLFPITAGNTDAYATNIIVIGNGAPPLQAPRVGAVSGGSPASAAYVTFGPSNELVIGQRFSPFPGFTGEIRVATGDVNGDGAATPDLIAAQGPGGSPRVVVIDGATGATIMNILVFEASFTGGLNVATADINKDGFSDIIVAADVGGGPRVKIISGKDQSVLADFFVFEPAFRGGVRVATGNIGSIDANGNGTAVSDGVPDIIAGAGVGGGPRISVLDGAAAAKDQIARIADFFAFELSLRNGVYVSAGDFNKDAIDDIVAGAGPGGGPRVTVFETKSVVSTPNTPTQLVNFFAFDSTSRDGVRVAAKNIDGDSVADLLVGEGAGEVGRVRSYSGGKLDSSNQPNLIDDKVVFDDFASLNGAWVG